VGFEISDRWIIQFIRDFLSLGDVGSKSSDDYLSFNMAISAKCLAMSVASTRLIMSSRIVLKSYSEKFS